MGDGESPLKFGKGKWRIGGEIFRNFQRLSKGHEMPPKGGKRCWKYVLQRNSAIRSITPTLWAFRDVPRQGCTILYHVPWRIGCDIFRNFQMLSKGHEMPPKGGKRCWKCILKRNSAARGVNPTFLVPRDLPREVCATRGAKVDLPPLVLWTPFLPT